MIAGREDNVSKILQWLQSGPSILGLQADSQHEAIAYFISSLSRFKTEERDQILARAIIVEDIATWRQLALWESPLILIPTFSDLKMISAAVEKGHHILVPLDKTEPPIGNTLSISRLHRMEAEKALLAMGLLEERAKHLAALARRSFEAMRRELAENAISLTPEWSKKPEIARSLLPALLAGQWDDKKAADQEVISSLAGLEYPEFREILINWSRKPDPPVRLVEHTWMVSAREDAWMLLARHLTDEVLERFASTAIDVLKEMDPKFELPVDERWLANIHGKVPKYSIYLRGGIAETLALMATLSNQCEFTTRSGQDWSNHIVGAIFDGVTDWKLWASLSPVLPLLAEASPEIFLGALERNLATPSSSLIQIFTDSENILTQSSPHTGLLWAFETLAWSPEYLSQSALSLASLARLDPGGKLSNHPLGSLREVFLIWHPCTTADLEQRLVVLDTVRRREPCVGWDLMVKLLPGSHNMAFPTAKPRHRNWLPEEETHVPFVEISRAITEIVLRLLEDVGLDGPRWRDLIRLLDDLPKPEFDVVTDRLLRISRSFKEPNRSLIWEALRHLLSKHLQLPDAKWTLPTAAIEQLRQCYERFEPENPIQKRNWLFSNRCSFPEAGASRGRERDNIIDQARIKAVEELFDEGGLQMLIDLVCQAEDAYLVGVALGKSRISDGQEGSFLKQVLGSTEPARSIAAFGFLFGCTSIKGQEWLRSLRSSKFWEEWTSKQRADYYISLPFDEITWDALDTEGDEIKRRYWLEVGINGRGDLEPKDCERIVSKLTDMGG